MSRNYDHLSREELLGLLSARDKRDATRFGLIWEANEIERDKALNRDFVALDLDPDLSCGDAPWQNLIIEGDNFDALRALNMSFKGQVKCIYIDPPYNTGNEGWKYNDNVSDPKIKKWLGETVGKEGDDLTRHDKWLCMIYPRLKLLSKLLTNDCRIRKTDDPISGIG